MIVTRIGSKQRWTVCRTSPVSQLPTQIMLPIACARHNLNAGIDGPHLVGHLPLWFRTSIPTAWLMASSITARLRLPLLLAAVRDTFFRSVSRSPCLLDFQPPVPKLARGPEACVPEDSVSDSPTSAQLMRCVRTVLCVVLPLLVVLVEVIHIAAAADGSGWWPSELCPYCYRRIRHPRRLKRGPGYHVEQT